LTRTYEKVLGQTASRVGGPSKSIFSKREEQMGTVPTMTKREGRTTKGIARIYNAGGITFSGDDGTIFPEATGQYSNSGADGDYTVTIVDGEPITIKGARTIRVLNHGELNLLTDTGQWYLFAPGTWKTAYPEQPKPGV
jgi:hypothetical protein